VVNDVPEVVVSRQHCQFVVNAKLGQESVDRSDLHSVATASVSQFGCLDVIVAIRHQQRHRRKTFENLISRLRPGESLQKLLKHEACRNYGLAALDRFDKRCDFSCGSGRIPPERKRPDAGIHEERQARFRSAL
jgi:hypothetical protein